ncbi:MAG: hypothetical protein RL040_900 [Bacteroidota bacterium]
MRIDTFDELDLVRTCAVLELLLSADCLHHCGEPFVVDKPMDEIPFGETFLLPRFVLPHTADDVAGDADIQHAIELARQDVGCWIFHVFLLGLEPRKKGKKVRGVL